VDLFLRLNAKPELSSGPLFDCSSESTSSDETCAVVSPDGAAATVWASVYGTFLVSCRHESSHSMHFFFALFY